MCFITLVVLCAIFTWPALFYLPWWSPALSSFLMLLLFPLKKSLPSFLAPALGAVIAILTIVLIRDYQNQHILSNKIAAIFQLPSGIFLVIITAIIGFISAGLGGWLAFTCRNILDHPSKKMYSTEEGDKLPAG